jgi:lysophospholipase L1-like esterase
MPQMLVLGDSIVWGQGLTEPDKCTSLLARAWEQHAGEQVTIHRYARSGADIWDDGQDGLVAVLNPSPPAFSPRFTVSAGEIIGSPGCAATQAERDALGEIPREVPYLLRQIADASRALAGTKVDLVVLDGGINDTEVYNLVIPRKSKRAVVERGASVWSRMAFALASIERAFPKAKVVVTGYYPVVSQASDPRALLQFFNRFFEAVIEEGLSPLHRVLTGLEAQPEDKSGLRDDKGDRVQNPALLDLPDRCAEWTTKTHAALRAAVAGLDRGRNVAAFVDPGFGPEHALFTPQSLLWPFENGVPRDPLASLRSAYCRKKNIRGFERMIIECASLGHPSAAGARRYADRLIAAARGLGLF